jgi:tRNA pseudouridine55 synthase
MDGLLLIDKPAGLSSFGVVARVRWLLSQQAGHKVKVGHTGTLDPFATGLMIVVVGSYCRRAQEFSKLDKSYLAAIRLGQTSSTGDPEGDVTDVSDRQPTAEEVRAALDKFKGIILQTPPSFSAIKIDGVRAYKLAREGKEVDMPTREVIIHDLKLVSYNYPELVIDTHVGSGTYIRTLAQDVGAQLGTGAYCTQLRRTQVGKYSLKDATPLVRDVTSAADLKLIQL